MIISGQGMFLDWSTKVLSRMIEQHVSVPWGLYLIVHLNNSTFSREGKEEKYFLRKRAYLYYKYLLNTTIVF